MYCFVFLQTVDRSNVQSCLVSSSNWFVHPNWKLVYKHETAYNVNYRSASLKPLKRQLFSLLSMLRSKQTNRQTRTNLFWSLVAVDVESKFHQQWPPFWILVPVLLVSGACPRALASAPLNSFFTHCNKTPLLLSNKQSLKKNNLLLEDLVLLLKDVTSVNVKRIVLASRSIVWKSTLVSCSAVVISLLVSCHKNHPMNYALPHWIVTYQPEY